MITHVEQEALGLALDAHADQIRTGSGDPYSVHPIRTWVLAKQDLAADRPNVLAAFLLHDVLEDTRASLHSFPSETRKLVSLVTWRRVRRRKNPPHDKVMAVRKAALNPWSLYIKVIDRLDNFSDGSPYAASYARRKSTRESTMLLLDLATQSEIRGSIYIPKLVEISQKLWS